FFFLRHALAALLVTFVTNSGARGLWNKQELIEAIGVFACQAVIEKEAAAERAVRHERNPINQIGACLENSGAGCCRVEIHLKMAIGQYDRRGADRWRHHPQSDRG